MERHFDSQIDDLRSLILTMGGCVERALDEATQALMQRTPDRFKLVYEIEQKINEDHIKVDNACMAFLAKQGPVAKDLRLIVSIIKINTDLERMGDQSVNIAYTGRDYLSRASMGPLDDIELMSGLVRKMVKDSLDCFVREDVPLAKEILAVDDEVDHLKEKILQELTNKVKGEPEHIEAALDLIFIAKNLERLGDHATNIAEDVIFVSTGKDVRHGGKFSGS